MISFGIRQSFDNIEQIQERYSALKAPIELALPYHWDIYEPVRVQLPESLKKAFIKEEITVSKIAELFDITVLDANKKAQK